MSARKRLSLLLVLLFFAVTANAQTTLQLGASWDNKAFIIGTVTLSHGTGENAVQDWTGTFKGWANINNFIIQPDTLYTVSIVTVNPETKANVTLSFSFIVPSLVMSPGKIHSATYQVVISQTTNQPVPGETAITVKF